MIIDNADVVRKAEELHYIQTEDKNIRAFLVASMIKLLAFQTDVLGNIKPPPQRKPREVMEIAKKKVEEFLKETYEEPKTGNSEEGSV